MSSVVETVGGFVGDITGGLFGGPAAAGEAAGIGAGAFREAAAGLEPFREAGLQALQQQQALLGLTGPEAQQQAFAGLQESPGQQFLRERQQRALLRSASAIGGLGGGNIKTALQQQAAGFGMQDIQNQLARLQAITGAGQQAAGGIGQLIGQAGQARAGGILGAQQARAGQVQNLLGLGSAFLLGSDRRLKENIQDLDLKACFEAVINTPLKSWQYLESVGLDTETHFGPIAQEAPDMIRQEVDGIEMIDLHDELIMIAAAIQYMHNNNMLRAH